MTSAETILSIIGALTPVLLMIFRWLDKRQDRRWRREDTLHKQKMELAALSTGRKLEVVAHKAENAERTVKESKRERAEQIKDLKETVLEGISVSNNYNGKITASSELGLANTEEIRQLRQDFQAGKPSTPEGGA